MIEDNPNAASTPYSPSMNPSPTVDPVTDAKNPKLSKQAIAQLLTEKQIKYNKSLTKTEMIHLLEGGGEYVSKEEAEKSAEEWMPIIREWLISAIMDPEQHRDIGKVLAQAAEIVGVKQLNELSGKENRLVVGMPYDCICEKNKPYSDEDNPVHRVRTQIKFRMGDWHFETTRRNSQKNAETNSTGHVAYRKDEFDLLAIFTPSKTFGITGSKLRCIPVNALVDPEKPHQLVTHIKANLRATYDNEEKTKEVIQQVYYPLDDVCVAENTILS